MRKSGSSKIIKQSKIELILYILILIVGLAIGIIEIHNQFEEANNSVSLGTIYTDPDFDQETGEFKFVISEQSEDTETSENSSIEETGDTWESETITESTTE